MQHAEACVVHLQSGGSLVRAISVPDASRVTSTLSQSLAFCRMNSVRSEESSYIMCHAYALAVKASFLHRRGINHPELRPQPLAIAAEANALPVEGLHSRGGETRSWKTGCINKTIGRFKLSPGLLKLCKHRMFSISLIVPPL